MKNYWVRIVLGAVGVFFIGMIIVTAIRKATGQVRMIRDTAEPVRIPFPFGIVPFRLDGTRLGNVEHMVLLRDAPEGISGIKVMVKLSDSAMADRLHDCYLVVKDIEHMNSQTTFACQSPDTSGLDLVPYGTVDIEGSGASFPLLLSRQAVDDLRSNQGSANIEARVDSIARQAEATADSLGQLADSIAERADSIRESAREKADSVRDAALRMADSIRQRRGAGPPRTQERSRP